MSRFLRNCYLHCSCSVSRAEPRKALQSLAFLMRILLQEYSRISMAKCLVPTYCMKFNILKF